VPLPCPAVTTETSAPPSTPTRPRTPSFGEFTEQVFLRTTGAPLTPGNGLRILKDSTENYPAWLEAIASARRKIYFENYIIGDDAVGDQFIRALAERARAGVHVRLVYDWLGTWASRKLWQPLIEAGGEVRCFNPPRLDSPFGWVSRDHRKSICVDGHVAFVTGLCVSQRWVGNPARGIEPWRDTGVELRGPGVAFVERAFAQLWDEMGSPIPEDELTRVGEIPQAGEVPLSVVASAPNTAGLYRLDQLIATAARRTLWLSDAYFVGVSPYVQALRAAALDGVDVRLLVPGSSDIPVLARIGRAGYRPLLEAGVRIFEWNGRMMHAKTAVADCRWARVGSSNLNISSWLGNYELDVAVEHEPFARQMEEMYLRDLEHATEIVLNPRNRVRPSAAVPFVERRRFPRGRGSASRAAASALRLGYTVGAALTNRRVLGPAEAGLMFKTGLVLLTLAVLGVIWPHAVAIPVGVIAAWIAVALLVRARRLRREPGESDSDDPGPG